MNTINFKIKVKSWRDKETGYWMLYSKKYGISAYGSNIAQATEMFNFQINDCLLLTKQK